MRNAVAVSSEHTFLGHFDAWVDLRVRYGVPIFQQHGSDDMADVWCLFEYVSYVISNKTLQSATMESNLSTIKYFPRISCGFKLHTAHPVTASTLKGAARSHADEGNQATVRRPISSVRLLAGEAIFPSWHFGCRSLWYSLCASFCFLTHASEMFAETSSRIHQP